MTPFPEWEVLRQYKDLLREIEQTNQRYMVDGLLERPRGPDLVATLQRCRRWLRQQWPKRSRFKTRPTPIKS